MYKRVAGNGGHHEVREATTSEAEEGEVGGGAVWCCWGVQAHDNVATVPCGEVWIQKTQTEVLCDTTNC